MSTFYQKRLDIDTKGELFICLTIDLIGNNRNMWDMDLAKLCHLTDPECIVKHINHLIYGEGSHTGIHAFCSCTFFISGFKSHHDK